MTFGTVEQAIADIAAGRMIIVADDEDRENEGDLICAAQLVTPEIVNFMTKRASGLLCLALTPERCDQLGLGPIAEANIDAYRTAYTQSVDAAPRFGVTTGISAQDRARTIQVAVDPATVPSDLVHGGHVQPLRARAGGVLQRVGHTEAAVDLARLAGLYPAGVICEILRDADGQPARRPELETFAAEHELTFITVAQLVAYRLRTERLVHRVAEARLPTEFGDWRIVGYHNDVDTHEHVALIYGDVRDGEDILVRVHSKCLTGDVFGSLRCDCGWQLHSAMQQIAEEGRGVVVYLDQEGRGIGLLNKLRAYELQDDGADTVEANERLGFKPDLRNYGIGAQILLDLGVRSIRPMTNNPRKLVGLEGYGLRVAERVPIRAPANSENRGYLETKQHKLGHLLAH
ncbi:MAG TPA: bifunctional 3,4-dihydroxy-2-butanone-4-phosphate synthase/GTP cyclohydrolase II [Gemmatimonadaceae bacterium]